ncbi:MAG: HAD-IC family P-type ATPase, partial [Methanosarcina sp.]|nr:HAD-IC family P-type ATPase [Methanosarcina sp.]
AGYTPEGKFLKEDPEGKGSENGDSYASGNDTHLHFLLLGAALCNDSSLHNGEDGWEIRGDPTEAALVVAAAKAGFEKSEIDRKYPRLAEIPFSSESKRMTTFNRLENGPDSFLDSKLVAFSKGAPEVILGSCTKIFIDGEMKDFTPEKKQEIFEQVKELADQALRVMAFSFRPFEESFPPEKVSSGKVSAEIVEEDMVFSGLTGMRDPPREEVKAAIKTCEDAGIKTVMITGDHKVTAAAIARELGILNENDLTLTGAELDDLEEEEFDDKVERVSVYSRVYPSHKLRVVEALKKKDYIVAMTGDGVNDAPALKAADMGIAMGITGTDVS